MAAQSTTVLNAIGNYLKATSNEFNRDLTSRWTSSMETQVNVLKRKGKPVEGKSNKYVWTDPKGFEHEFWPIRIPTHADSDPEWKDYELNWPFDWFAEAIGSTGWDWQKRVSKWVGFDFDAITEHGQTGLTADDLETVRNMACELPYVEARKSTGGKGLHIYVHLGSIPTSNHTQHAALARHVLSKMGDDCGFDFAHQANGNKLVDVCGGNMWIWHRKMTLEDEGFRLLKPADTLLTTGDFPNDWQNQIEAIPTARPSSNGPASAELIQRAMQYAAKAEKGLSDGRRRAMFRLAGSLFSFVDEGTGHRLNEEQLVKIVETVNMTYQSPLADEVLREQVHNAMIYGTLPSDKVVEAAVTVDDVLAPTRQETSATTAAPSKAPILIKINHELDRMVKQAAKALGDAANTYAYGQALVEVVYDAEKPKQCLFDNGSPQLVPIPKPTLATRLSVCAQWEKYLKNDGWVPAAPNDKVVNAVHVLNRWPSVPTITGIVSSPVLRADGSILVDHGYDRETGLFLEGDEPFPSLMCPQSAVSMLHDVVSDFPFEKDAHRSAWLAFLITLLARSAFAGSAPFFLFDANCSGAGKGLLTDVTTMIVEGRKACRYSWSKDNEETRKLITTVGVSGVSYLLWDNVVGKLGGAALEQMMTTGVWADRILSLNRQVTFPIRFIAAGTSNNAKLSHDMIRRTCHSKLLTPEENPSERSGFRYPNLLSHVKSRRRELVMAALSIPAGYVSAGRPDQNLRPWGGFEEWSSLVRGAIVWAGLPDPGETREGLRDQTDDDTATLRAILAAWPTEPITVAQAVQMAEANTELGEAMSELPSRNRGQELGNMLRGARGRVIAGKRLYGTTTKPVKWHVVDASPVAAAEPS